MAGKHGKRQRRQVTEIESTGTEEFERRRGVTAIQVDSGLTQVVIPMRVDMGRRSCMFRTLADADISVFFIKLHPVSVNFCVSSDVGRRVQRTLKRTLNLTARLRQECSQVSIVSSAMRDLPGVMSGIVEVAHEKGIKLLETGDAHDAVVLLVRHKDSMKLVRALRRKFEV